ncbi:MAG TPA: CDP-archaeol synthase [Pseudomonadales bacterium]|jgi:CDP-2,3-bis-(O-geranylgeranyl)-sn-glycerol synthase
MNLDLILALKVLALALSANGAPVIGKRLFGARWAIPLDGGLTFLDGRPLLGSSKTVRGLVLSLATTTLVATALGYGWQLGVIYSALTMSGDALSSFVKRRRGIPPSGRFRGLDQIPETALPMWVCSSALGLTGWDIAVLVALFFAGDFVLSKVLYRIGIRDEPY